MKGRLTKYGRGGPLEIPQIPSYLLHQVKGVQPIFAQQILGYATGEIDGFDAITRGVGMHTTSLKIRKKKKEK